MEILKLVSGGMPTMFADVSHIGYKEKLIYLPNCGSMCTYYAGRHCEGCKNMKNIELRRANRPSGGAVTFTVPSAGVRADSVGGRHPPIGSVLAFLGFVACLVVAPTGDFNDKVDNLA